METTTLTFGAPYWFWGFLVLPFIALLYLMGHYRGRRLVTKIVAPRLHEELVGSVSIKRRVIRAILVLATFALTLVALARPQYGFIQQEIKQKGRDIVIAVDTSRSMLATDLAPDRLTRAKLLTQDLLRLFKGDRVGLVAFAGSAFLQAPLTLDYSAVINALEELDTTVIPKGGTNIAAAIKVAEQAFGKAEGQTRALVILTDGEELDADGVAAAKKAAELGIRIFTVGIGSPEGSLIPIRTDDGRQDFVRDRAGKPVQSRLDASRLEEIAKATGGFYVSLGPDTAHEVFQKGIVPMDLSETGILASRQPLERYQWPLSFAIVFLTLWLLVSERRKMRNGNMRHVVAIFLFALASGAMAAPAGLEDYQKGEFEKAKQSFERLLKAKPDSHKLQFNAGTAAYKLGDFSQAISYFTSALLAENKSLREEAAYNLANALVRRGEAAKETDAKKADWKNAIEQYTEALKIDPKNKQAEENRELVKKLLKELEQKEKQKKEKKEEEKQNQKQEQQKDQKNQQQDKQNKQKKDQKDQQNSKDQQKQDQQQQDQQNGEQKNQKENQQKDQTQQNKENAQQSSKENKNAQQEQKPNPSSDAGEQRDQKKSQENKKSAPVPTPTPGEKKEGELKTAHGDDQKTDKKPESKQEAMAATGEEKEGEMSAAQARGLLNSLRSEEEKVNLMQQQTSQEVLRDW